MPIVSHGFGFGADGRVKITLGDCAGSGGGIVPLGATISDDEGVQVGSVQGAINNSAKVIWHHRGQGDYSAEENANAMAPGGQVGAVSIL